MNASAHAFKSTLTPEIEAGRRRAMRALLRSPLLPATGESGKEYVFVRQHSAWLKQWLARFPGWDLHIDSKVARLRKTPADSADSTRAAMDAPSGSPFTRRRYALLCLALAALERAERQTTIAVIAQTIMEFVAADRALQDAGLVFDISNHDQRRDLVHAVRRLIELGLLRRVHGDEREFLDRTGTSDVLYDIDRSVLAVILNISRSPSAIEASEQAGANAKEGNWRPLTVEEHASRMNDDPPPAGDDGHALRIRARLVRALMDDPILFFDDLHEEERTYLEAHRSYLLEQIHDATGLIPEVRREGIAMVDDGGDLTDARLPEEGTDGHIGLLLAEWLAEFAKNSPGLALPVTAIEERVGKLIRIHGSRWRKSVRDPGAERRVAQDTVTLLAGLRLVRVTPEGIVPLAAIGRYAPASSSPTADLLKEG